ncbi:cytochrome P450 [Saccharopolyspora sp. MS10]|uniref:cytochrome P450 n=1 Tax=Saccharopolyspora sp. MS10 TaxID=3385973 RepID=UPI0039A0BC06
MTEFPDPADPEFVADPYPAFRALRERGPLHRHEGWGAHVAVSHELCSAVLRHRDLRRVWVDRAPEAEFEAFNALHRLSMLENEQRLHGRLRAAAAPLFHRRAVAAMRGTITELVGPRLDRLREEIEERGRAELMSALAGPLPVDVIAALLGFPLPDGPVLRDWSNRIVRMYEPELDEAGRRDAERAAGEFRTYVAEHVEHRRARPGEDPLSALIATGALNRDELVATCALLLMAGHEASVNGIGNAVVALHDHPAQRRLFRRLSDDPTAVATAVDELLRHDTPNQLFERTAVRDVEVSGHRVEAGEKVVVLLGAANRDPAAFTAPDELDLTRSPNPHLALGVGAHYCLGAPLARLEMGVVLAEFAARFPEFSLAERPRRSGAFALRGYERVEITA